ncbi:hypothetical protein ACFQU2_02600 [Siccirubricoccus deserti]
MLPVPVRRRGAPPSIAGEHHAPCVPRNDRPAAAGRHPPLGRSRPGAGRQDFALVNRTGYQINEIYVGPTSSDSWGRDILGNNVLADRRTFNVRFGSRTQACQWDIKVVYDDGDTSDSARSTCVRSAR